MRSISIRQFQQNLYHELATLPFTVTRRGKPFFNVTTSDVTTIPKPIYVTTFIKKEFPVGPKGHVIKTPKEVIAVVDSMPNLSKEFQMKGRMR